MPAAYDLLLDLFPLCSEVQEENLLLGQELQRAALSLLDDAAAGARVKLLLRLCNDLGYLDDDVCAYLLRGIDTLSPR